MAVDLPRGVRDLAVRLALPSRRDAGDPTDRAVREETRAVVGRVLDRVAATLEAGETVRRLYVHKRHRVGVRGVRVGLRILVLTDRRILLGIEDPIDDVALQVGVHAYGTVAVRPKLVQIGVEPILEPAGLVVEVGRGRADEMTAELAAPPAPSDAIAAAYGAAGVAGPASAAAPVPPAGWHPDPTGRHDHRWWDGTTWTDQVSDAGTAGTDPLG
jgi:hypothetical protein